MVQALYIYTLQSVLNAAACIIIQKRTFDPITTSIRDELHWLPINQIIEYQLSALVFKCLRWTAPPYPTKQCILVSADVHRQRLRSSTRNCLMCPRVNLSRYCARGFYTSGPKTWNQLPDNDRDTMLPEQQFYKLLKTILLQRAYYPWILCTFVLDICKRVCNINILTYIHRDVYTIQCCYRKVYTIWCCYGYVYNIQCCYRDGTPYGAVRDVYIIQCFYRDDTPYGSVRDVYIIQCCYRDGTRYGAVRDVYIIQCCYRDGTPYRAVTETCTHMVLLQKSEYHMCCYRELHSKRCCYIDGTLYRAVTEMCIPYGAVTEKCMS